MARSFCASHVSNMDVLMKQFLCCSSFKEITWDHVNSISWDEQKLLVDKTVANPIVLKYPIKYSYQLSFLKHLIKHLENNGIEIHDDIYGHHCTLLQNRDLESDYFYKHYLFDDKSTVKLKENSKLISDGTTGLHTWEASLVLSEWCLQNINYVKNKTIMELGSGIGLTAIVISKFCSPKKIYATDCHPEVLKILRENVQLNCHLDKFNKTLNQENLNMAVLELPWEEICNNEIPKQISIPDLVIAADVVYDPSIFPLLSGAILYFLNQNKNCEMIMACTIRNENTLNKFLNLLEELNMKISKLDPPSSETIYFSPSSKVNVYKITK